MTVTFAPARPASNAAANPEIPVPTMTRPAFGGGAAEGFDARELLHDFFLQEGGRDAAWHSPGVPPEVKQLICSLN